MTARVIVYALGLALPLAAAAWLLDRAAGWLRRPRRGIWALLLVATVVLPLALPWLLTATAPPSDAQSAAAERRAVTGHVNPAAALLPSILTWRDRVTAAADAILDAADRLNPAARVIWLAGTVGVLLLHAAARVMLKRRRRSWRRASVAGADVLVAREDGPAVVGIAAPQIVVPEWALTLPPPALDLMLTHEREHQRARDPLLIHAAGLACLVMPWNPAVWWMWTRVRLAVEIDCDARVLRRAALDLPSRPDHVNAYGELLLAVVSHRSPRRALVAPAMLERTSTLTRRISAMYPSRLRLLGVRAGIAGAAACGLVAAALMIPSPAVFGREITSEGTRLAGGKTAPPFKAPTPAVERERLMRHFPTTVEGPDHRPKTVGGQESMAVVFIQDGSGRILGTTNTMVLERLLKLARGNAELQEHMTEAQAREAHAREERGHAEEHVGRAEVKIEEQMKAEAHLGRHEPEPTEAEMRAANAAAEQTAAELFTKLVSIDRIHYEAGEVAPAVVTVFYITVRDQQK